MIKGIQPDFSNIDNLAGNYVGVVMMNMVWATWEPAIDPPPCSGTQQEYEGRCYTINAATDNAIREWSERGVAVSAAVYGVPEWARTGNTGCSPIADGFEVFCAPDDAAEYGRFAGMIAQRYDGLHGHGRISDFVIHNEVNVNDWFDIGCGQGVACDQSAWIQTYADSFASAHDQIVKHQSAARVLIPLTHHFDTDFDLPAAHHASISVKTFISQLAGLIGDRGWQIAFHPYAPSLLSPEFSPLDWPFVTYGNIGAIVGWLRATFPSRPETWQVQLTESGISSGTPDSSEAAQAPAVCATLYNVLATPGITSYIYHRLKDHPAEAPLALGLVRGDGSPKPAWSVWANANRIDDSPPQLGCGFEHLPYTRLTRSVKNELLGVHWTSSRRPPQGFDEEQSWYLLRESASGTALLFECMVDELIVEDNTYLSADVTCGGDVIMGPVGYIHTSQVGGSVALYSCRTSVMGLGFDRFVSTDPACEGTTSEGLLGYAQPTP